MSFYTVIYSSLGMSTFWEIVEEVCKINEICRFFSGKHWEWTWAPFRVDLGTIWGAVGRQNRNKGDPETLTENDKKRDVRLFGWGWPPKLTVQRTSIMTCIGPYRDVFGK